MLRRLFIALLSILAIVVMTPSAAVTASGDHGYSSSDGRTKRSASDDIWTGLCVGASLELSQSSAIRCERQQAAAQTKRARNPAGPPNIQAGLCVGASLSLSQASAANCLQKQAIAEEQRRSRPAGPPDIETGLCVGASLDFSFSSAARCAQKQVETPRPNQHQKHRPDYVPEKTKPQPKQPRSDKYHYDKHQYKEQRKPAKAQKTTAHQQQSVEEYRELAPRETAPSPVSTIQYAALGDSVAAGTGLPPNPNSDNGTCGRSSLSYPYIVANARGLDLDHIACTGAGMSDLLAGQRSTRRPGIPAQLDSAFATGTPQLITITAGANDARWDAMLLKCLRRTCGTPQDTRTIESSLTILQTETQAVLQEIKQRSSGSPPQVIITGYYNPASANCAATQSRATTEEIAWIDNQLNRLNETLASAARNSSLATFVPIDFTGHDICSSDPWVQGPNDPSPLHPTAAGQQAMARMILADP